MLEIETLLCVGTVSAAVYTAYQTWKMSSMPTGPEENPYPFNEVPLSSVIGSRSRIVKVTQARSVDGLPQYLATLDTGETVRYGGASGQIPNNIF